MNDEREKERVLLHICCAPDATYCASKLIEDGFAVTGFFYNPCIEPESEYERRLAETVKVARAIGFDLLETPYENAVFREAVAGLEEEPEGGARCEKCFRLRLAATAVAAESAGFTGFTTTLTISPHKDVAAITNIGIETARENKVRYLPYLFRKNDGFKKSVALSHQLGLYRQNYCGCIFSL